MAQKLGSFILVIELVINESNMDEAVKFYQKISHEKESNTGCVMEFWEHK